MSMRVLSDIETKKINNSGVFEFVNAIFGKTMHAKRVQSLANAALGLLHAEELILHKIGAFGPIETNLKRLFHGWGIKNVEGVTCYEYKN